MKRFVMLSFAALSVLAISCSKNGEVTSIAFDKTELTIVQGAKEVLSVTFTPSNATNKELAWSSTDESVATVSEGVVSAIAPGITYIIANCSGKMAKCTVTVTAPKGAVDLGLPSGLKWAESNLGATYPEDYGWYYSWGEVVTKTEYTWTNYKWGKWWEENSTVYESMTKYNTKPEYGSVDNKTVLEESDDAARVVLGGNWRTPTADDWNELKNNCDWKWTNLNGINGYKVSASNGNSIFLPAAGSRENSDIKERGSHGIYQSSSLHKDIPSTAWVMSMYSQYYTYYYARYYGFSVRPVIK